MKLFKYPQLNNFKLLDLLFHLAKFIELSFLLCLALMLYVVDELSFKALLLLYYSQLLFLGLLSLDPVSFDSLDELLLYLVPPLLLNLPLSFTLDLLLADCLFLDLAGPVLFMAFLLTDADLPDLDLDDLVYLKLLALAFDLLALRLILDYGGLGPLELLHAAL